MSCFDDAAILCELRNESTRESAFKVLFDKFYIPIRFQAYRGTGDFHAAEDISQEVFQDFWVKQLFMKEDIRSFSALLLKICHRKCGHYHQQIARRGTHRHKISFDLKTQQEPQVKGDTYRYVALLPKQQRNAIQLVYELDLPQEDAAKIMKISKRTLQVHLDRAKKLLATILS